MPLPEISTAFITENPDLELFLAAADECSECEGTGKINTRSSGLVLCPACDGTGLADFEEDDDDYPL